MTLHYHWNIVGHERLLGELEQDILQSNIAHAYLLAGVQHVGKFSIAKKMAQILQCEKDFCGICQTCQHIEKGYHFDTIEVLDDGEAIKIERIREALNQLYLSPQGRYRILLMENIERMTIEAANSLLKTLEDPPPQVQFLLTTSNIKELPTTIVSRVRLYKFHAFSEPQMRDFLQKFFPVAEAADIDTVVTLSGGKPGKALSLLQNSELLNYYKNLYNQLSVFLKKGDRVAQFAYVAEIAKDDQQVKDFLEVFLAVIRYDLLENFGQNSRPQDVERKIILIKKIQQTQEMMKRNVNTRLALENIMLAL